MNTGCDRRQAPPTSAPAARRAATLALCAIFVAATVSACIFNPDNGNDTSVNWQTDPYEFEQRFICFCVEPAGRFQRIRVRNDSIVSVTDLATGEALAPDRYDLFKTVPQLIELANSVDPDSVAELQLTYDDVYGYPTDIYIDYNATIADEEIGFESRNLHLLR